MYVICNCYVAVHADENIALVAFFWIMVRVVLITSFALLLRYVEKPFAMWICNAIVELGGGLMFFLSLVRRRCAVNVNSVSEAFSTNQNVDLFVTLETLDVR